MGSEATAKAHFGKKQLAGKALLETSELFFRPADNSPRLKIPFATVTSAKAVNGQLRLQTADGLTVIELGSVAEKWCHKILHPKTRSEKLGVKPGLDISLLGEFEREFLSDLRATTKNVHEGKINPASEMIFLIVDTTKNLASVARVAKTIKGATALWVVYPKGKKEITENDVLSSGRKTGLKDVKVVGFSATHTALKFVLPLDKR